MIVCVCRRVSDRDIHKAVKSGACSMRELNDQLGVATQCGKCGVYCRKLLKQSQISQQDKNNK